MLGAFSFDELAIGFGLLSIAVFFAIFVFRGLHRRGLAEGEAAKRDDAAAVAPAMSRAAAGKLSLAQRAKAWFETRLRSPYAIVDAALTAIGIAGIILTLLNGTSLWRVLWMPHVGALDLNRLVFPDLNGRWTGVILSNGRLQGYEDGSNALSYADCIKWFGPYEEKSFVCLPITYDISMSLFAVSLQLDSGTLQSVSKGVSLKRRTERSRAQLTYLFDVSTSEPQRNEAKFTGAASIEVFDSGKDLTLEGIYWTERNWPKGKQTGGRIKLIRASAK